MSCREPAGWWRRWCRECRQLLALFESQRGADMATMMAAFTATGVARDKIERFLASDPDGSGAIRDRIAADMTNALLQAFGQRQRQTPAEVKRIRDRGGWVHLDRPPPE